MELLRARLGVIAAPHTTLLPQNEKDRISEVANASNRARRVLCRRLSQR